jgi:uncharacterized protein (DUF1015 family)
VARLKPFRALRYDTDRAGPLASLVGPPHDVIDEELRARLLAASPHNVVRLVRPDSPEEGAKAFREWQEEGILVRDDESAAWVLEEDFAGPDGRLRTRRAVVGRIRLEPYGGAVLPHERTIAKQKQARLELLRAVRAKLSPVLLLHEGLSPEPPQRDPDLEVEFDGVWSRLWRADPSVLDAVRGSVIIADGHHRYETALRFHEEEGSEETAYLMAALVARGDAGLVIFPTHRLATGPVPELNGRFRVTTVDGGAEEALARLGQVAGDHAAFVLLRPEGAALVESSEVLLDTAVIDGLSLDHVRYTPSAKEAEQAVRTGGASAAFLVRAPTMEQVESVALAGKKMPEKSTYFFPKLTSGLLFSPFDE